MVTLWILSWLSPWLSSPIAPMAETPAPIIGKLRADKSHQEDLAKALHRRIVSINQKDAPLAQTLADLQEVTGIPILLDRPALADANLDHAFPISLSLERVSLNTILNMVCDQCKMTYMIRDECIQVTTPEVARGRIARVEYPVGDLLVDQAVLSLRHKVRYRWELAEELTKLVTGTVAPTTWADAGGKGTITFSRKERTLVVRQYRDVHEDIADLLAALRRLQELEVLVCGDLIFVPSDKLSEFRAALPTADEDSATCLLDSAELLEAAARARLCHKAQFPSQVTDNGQPTQAGPNRRRSLLITPTAAADRQSFQVTVSGNDKELSFRLPAGKYALVDLGPAGSSRDTLHLFVLLRPMMLVNEAK